MGSGVSSTSEKHNKNRKKNNSPVTVLTDVDDWEVEASRPIRNSYSAVKKPQQGRPPVQTTWNEQSTKKPSTVPKQDGHTWPVEKEKIGSENVIQNNRTVIRAQGVTVSSDTVDNSNSNKNNNNVNNDFDDLADEDEDMDEEKRLQRQNLIRLKEERFAREMAERQRKARALEEHRKAMLLHEKLPPKRRDSNASLTGSNIHQKDNSAGADGSTSVEESSETSLDSDWRPTILSKSDILPDVGIFSDIDKHAATATKPLRAYLPNLVEYLVKPASNRLDQVRVFYRWIALNISFDFSTNEMGQYDNPTDPPAVLLNGSTNSLGFARLMEAFCEEVGIPAEILYGYSKGVSYRVGDVVSTNDPPDHVWNAVKLGSSWFFIDVMWGTGYVTEDGKFTRQFKEFYFLTDPDKFIYTHYPYMDSDNPVSNYKLQLLHDPISLQEFSDMMFLEWAALEWGVRPLTHRDHLINVRRQVDIGIEATGGPIDDYTVRLYQKDINCTMAEHVLAYKIEGNVLRIHVELPEEADYFLEIFGQRRGDDRSDPQLLFQYILSCSEVHKDPKKFPTHYRIYGAVPDYASFGFFDDVWRKVEYLAPGGEVSVSLMCREDLPLLMKLEHIDVELDMDQLSMVNGSGVGKNKIGFRDFFARLPVEGYYKLTIFGKEPSTDNFRPALTYLVDCQSPCTTCTPYPKVFPSVMEFRCKLLSPLTRELPAKTRVLVKLRSEMLREVRVMNLSLAPKDYKEFEGYVITPDKDQPFTILGAMRVLKSPFVGLFHFTII